MNEWITFLLKNKKQNFSNSQILGILNEKTNFNLKLPLKAARCDAIAKWISFRGFESELRTNAIQFHLDSL